MATFDDFAKLDIRVGTIKNAEIFKKAKRPAYKLIIDFGEKIRSTLLHSIWTPGRPDRSGSVLQLWERPGSTRYPWAWRMWASSISPARPLLCDDFPMLSPPILGSGLRLGYGIQVLKPLRPKAFQFWVTAGYTKNTTFPIYPYFFNLN